MYTVEFKTILGKGFVTLPDNLSRLQPGLKAKVVVLLEDEAEVPVSVKKSGFIEKLANNPVHVDKSLQFLSREDANER